MEALFSLLSSLNAVGGVALNFAGLCGSVSVGCGFVGCCCVGCASWQFEGFGCVDLV